MKWLAFAALLLITSCATPEIEPYTLSPEMEVLCESQGGCKLITQEAFVVLLQQYADAAITKSCRKEVMEWQVEKSGT